MGELHPFEAWDLTSQMQFSSVTLREDHNDKPYLNIHHDETSYLGHRILSI